MTRRDGAARDRQAALLAKRGDIHDCCKVARNLLTVETTKDTFLSVCCVCQRKHYRMVAESGLYPVSGLPTGGSS